MPILSNFSRKCELYKLILKCLNFHTDGRKEALKIKDFFAPNPMGLTKFAAKLLRT